jgi:hypothetical protein
VRQGKCEALLQMEGRPVGPGGVFLVITVILNCFHDTFADLLSSASLYSFTNYLWTVKLLVEIGIQVVSLVSHQVAEWPIGRRDTSIT